MLAISSADAAMTAHGLLFLLFFSAAAETAASVSATLSANLECKNFYTQKGLYKCTALFVLTNLIIQKSVCYLSSINLYAGSHSSCENN